MATAEVSRFAGIKEAFPEPWCVPGPVLGMLTPGPQPVLFTSRVTVCAERHGVQGVLTEVGTYCLVLQHP